MEFAWRRLEVDRVATVNRHVTGKEVGIAPDTTTVNRVSRHGTELLVVGIAVTDSDPKRPAATRVGRHRYGDDKCERENRPYGGESAETTHECAL
jgi:hypothetical protein